MATIPKDHTILTGQSRASSKSIFSGAELLDLLKRDMINDISGEGELPKPFYIALSNMGI
jgi:hypothetical protein